MVLLRRVPYLGRRCVTIEAKIDSLGLKMPSPAVPKGNFTNFVRVGNMVYLSGHLPQPAEGALVVGKVGKELTVEDGKPDESKYV
jgi:6-phosphogluconolactonase